MEKTDFNELYQAPKAELEVESKTAAGNEFFGVSIKKLCVMYAVTLGLYALVFFYKNWKAQKVKHNLKIQPVLRAIFAVFFVHSLFCRIRNEAKSRNIESNIAATGMATLYIVSSILSSLAGNVPLEGVGAAIGFGASILFMFLALYPLYRAQKIANLVNDDEHGNANSNFSAINWVMILLGALMWAMVVFGVYATIAFPELV